MNTRLPLSPEERPRRSVALTVAEVTARVSPVPVEVPVPAATPEETGCANDCTHPSHRHGDQPRASYEWPEEAVRWRPVVDRVEVVPLPGGWKLLVVSGGLRIKLPPEPARHIGLRLIGEP